MKLITLGDSITWGYLNHDPNTYRGHPTYPERIGIVNGWEVTNAGISGTEIADGNDRLTDVIYRYNFANYDKASIMFGTNDYNNGQESLDDVRAGITTAINKIRGDNPNILIYGILPLQTFLETDSLDKANVRGFSQNQLADTMSYTYKSFNVPVYDWRSNPLVTVDNWHDTLSDEQHPNNATYTAMGNRLAEFLSQAELLSVTDVWQLLSILNHNFLMINEYLNDFVEWFNSAELIHQTLSMPHVSQISSNRLDRAFRVQMLQGFEDTKSGINGILSALMDTFIKDYSSGIGRPYPLVTFETPLKLLIQTDDYNHCWDAIRQGLAELEEIKTEYKN